MNSNARSGQSAIAPRPSAARGSRYGQSCRAAEKCCRSRMTLG